MKYVIVYLFSTSAKKDFLVYLSVGKITMYLIKTIVLFPLFSHILPSTYISLFFLLHNATWMLLDFLKICCHDSFHN